MVELVRSENQFISIPKNMIRPKLSIKLFKLFLSVNGSYRYYKLIVMISKISFTLILTKNAVPSLFYSPFYTKFKTEPPFSFHTIFIFLFFFY